MQARRRDAETPRRSKETVNENKSEAPSEQRLQQSSDCKSWFLSPTNPLWLFISDSFSRRVPHVTLSNDTIFSRCPPNTVALDKSRYEVMVASMSRVAARSLVGMGSIPMKAGHPDDSSCRSPLLILLFRYKLHGQFGPLTVLL